ncbi:MAG: 50S ribosomal protein L22 [Deltaproteobacteria bacterium]|nr:50S ribosomal protein L22 [Deltaproteobacteria bacterium]
MQVRASLKFLRMGPRKVRLVADLVRGTSIDKAISMLRLTPRVAAGPVKKLLESAVANAKDRGNIDVDTLLVKTITVDPGPTLKRWMPRAQGRATPIRKRTSHVHVILEEA